MRRLNTDLSAAKANEATAVSIATKAKEAAAASMSSSTSVATQAPAGASGNDWVACGNRPERAVPFTAPPPVNNDESEEALTRWHNGKWGGAGEGRARSLCYVNNNQKFVDQNGKWSHMWDLEEWNKLDGDGQVGAEEAAERGAQPSSACSIPSTA